MMRIIKIKQEGNNKFISLQGFDEKTVLLDGVLIIDSDTFMALQDFMLGMYYS